MAVDSYAYLPKSFIPMFEAIPVRETEPVWAELKVPVSEARVALLSSAGMFLPASQAPFDVEREKAEPEWGDPTYRLIPSDTSQGDIDAAHLHINTYDVCKDVNVALPIRALHQLVERGVVGGSADEHISVMGYQQDGADVWRDEIGPEIAAMLRSKEIDALVLAPA